MGKRNNHASYTLSPTLSSVVKAKWDVYMEELGLEDETAVHALRHGTDAAVEIRAWVSANCTRTFIPEAVLGVLGVQMMYANVLKRIEEEIC
jgi:hypothetical protein